MALLHVILAAPADIAQADQALTAVRRALPRNGEQTVLLFCDLPDAPHIRMPEDEALMRRLQSGIMRIERLRPGRAILLIRRRAWSDAARQYLGQTQAIAANRVIALLLTGRPVEATFDAVSRSPRALAGCFDAVLVSDVSLSCSPDVPGRMQHAMRRCGWVFGPIVRAPRDEEPLLGRLLRQGFSLSEHLPEHALPFMTTPQKLLDGAPACTSIEADCPFVSRETPSLDALLQHARVQQMQSRRTALLLLPVVEMLLLFLAAVTGHEVLAYLALIWPERSALVHPIRLPGALVRLALLPALAASALDVALSRLLRRSPRLRLSMPAAAQRPFGCVPFGVALWLLAFLGVHALVPLLPVSLLWVLAPWIARALDLPVRERIPLTKDEQLQLRGEAESLYFSLAQQPSAFPGQRMLSHGAALLLGLLEPDEAARHVEALLPALHEQLQSPEYDALSCAAALCAAQLLRERMGECDAALRPLPGQVEALILRAPAPQGQTLLARLVRAALFEDSAPLRTPGAPDASADGLFLPLSLLNVQAPDDATLPLTHPHTYIARKSPCPATEACDVRFLSLVSAFLDRPLQALFARSAIIAPVMPALAAASPSQSWSEKRRDARRAARERQRIPGEGRTATP